MTPRDEEAFREILDALLKMDELLLKQWVAKKWAHGYGLYE